MAASSGRRLLAAAATLLALSAPRPAECRLGLAATALTSATFEPFVRDSPRVLVDFVKPDDVRWREQQSALVEGMRRVRDYGCRVPFATVDATAEEALARRFVPKGNFPQLMWFLNGEPTQYHRNLRTARAIADFVLALDRDPIVLAKSAEEVKNYNRAVLAHVPTASPMFRALEVVASKHMDTMAVVVVDSPKGEVSWVANGTEPVRYDGETSVQAVDRWVRGQLVMSEAVPGSGDGPVVDGGSVVVVGKTFEDVVLRPDRDVFLLIYAPWCGFSRRFLPVWEALAKAVLHVPHLLVAKMDGDRNGSPLPEEFSWTGYPTVFFVKAGRRSPVVFHGNRTVANLVEFANEHGSHPVSLDASVPGVVEAEL